MIRNITYCAERIDFCNYYEFTENQNSINENQNYEFTYDSLIVSIYPLITAPNQVDKLDYFEALNRIISIQTMNELEFKTDLNIKQITLNILNEIQEDGITYDLAAAISNIANWSYDYGYPDFNCANIIGILEDYKEDFDEKKLLSFKYLTKKCKQGLYRNIKETYNQIEIELKKTLIIFL